jgi:hypothetical protein
MTPATVLRGSSRPATPVNETPRTNRDCLRPGVGVAVCELHKTTVAATRRPMTPVWYRVTVSDSLPIDSE